MLRRSLYRLFTLSEARELLGIRADSSARASAGAPPSSGAKAPLLMMPTVLQILKEHHASKDDALLQSAVEQLVALDRTSLDSAMVAVCRIPKTLSVGSGGVVLETTAGQQEANPNAPKDGPQADAAMETENVVLSLMRYFVHSLPMREYCCRCLANMSLLSLPQSPAAASGNNADNAGKPQPPADVAAQLVRDGALEQVLGTLHMGARLSRRGQCWAGMALLNLLCLSPNGIRRLTGVRENTSPPQQQQQQQSSSSGSSASSASPAARGVEAMDTIAEFILAILDEETFLASSAAAARHQKKLGAAADPQPANPSSFSGFPAEQVAAVDAAIGALTILLQAEAPENAKGVHSHAELVHFTPILAISKTLLMASALLVRDGRNDGAYSVSLPKRREGLSVRLSQCSPHQGAAIVALLPLLHKTWVAMRVLCRHTPNLPLVFESMLECTRATTGSKDGATTSTSSSSPDADITEVSPSRPHASFGFHSVVEATLFLLSELDGLSEMKPFNASLVQVHAEVCEAAMEVLATWTTAPQDQQRASESTESSHSSFSSPSTTAAYEVALDELCSGTVSGIALSTAVRVHAEQCEKRAELKSKNKKKAGEMGSPHEGVNLPAYDLNSHMLLSKALQTLQNLIEMGNRPAGATEGEGQNTSASDTRTSRGPSAKTSQAEQEEEGDSSPRVGRVVDEVAVSPNTVAALQVILRNGIEVLGEITECSAAVIASSPKQDAVVEDLSYLFVARGGGSETAASSSNPSSTSSTSSQDSGNTTTTTTTTTTTSAEHTNSRREAQSFLLLQESALLGQVCAILYSLMRQEAGARAILDDILAGERDVAESSVPAGGVLMGLLSSLQDVLKGTYVKALECAKGRSSEGWSTTREEETLVCLTELTDKLLQSLHMLKNLQQQRETALKKNAGEK